MKKIVGIVLVTVCIFALVGCGCSNGTNTSKTTSNSSNSSSNQKAADVAAGQSTVADDLKVDYGNSTKYTKQDMDLAIEAIKTEFKSWPGGCVLHSISYSSDDENNDKNVKWMNELKVEKGINENLTQCIMFKTNFHSPVNGGGAWEADKEYTDYQWWLARSDGGQWHIMTYGY